MVTTIQLREDVKKQLDILKKGKRSYEEVIVELINLVDKQKRKQEDLLIEGYKEMAEESIKINKEFEAIDEDFDWEWK